MEGDLDFDGDLDDLDGDGVDLVGEDFDGDVGGSIHLFRFVALITRFIPCRHLLIDKLLDLNDFIWPREPWLKLVTHRVVCCTSARCLRLDKSEARV